MGQKDVVGHDTEDGWNPSSILVGIDHPVDAGAAGAVKATPPMAVRVDTNSKAQRSAEAFTGRESPAPVEMFSPHSMHVFHADNARPRLLMHGIVGEALADTQNLIP